MNVIIKVTKQGKDEGVHDVDQSMLYLKYTKPKNL